MARTTQAEVLQVFTLLCKALGKTQGTKEIGQWYLDNNPGYGGWCICERSNSNGAESRPYGIWNQLQRLPSREFVNCMEFALQTLEIANRQAK